MCLVYFCGGVLNWWLFIVAHVTPERKYMISRIPEGVKVKCARTTGQRPQLRKTFWWLHRRTEALSTRARAWGEVGVKSQGYSPAECLDQSLSRGTQTSFILQFNQHGLIFLYADCMSVSCFWDVRCIHYTSVENCLRCPDIMTCNLSRPAVAAFEITSKLFLHSWEQILSFTFCLTDRLTEEFWT